MVNLIKLLLALVGAGMLGIPFFYKFGFISDDFFILNSIANLPLPMAKDWTNGDIQMFRPFISLSYSLTYHIFKNFHYIYYLQNIVIHFLNSLLVFKISCFLFDYLNVLKSKNKSYIVTFMFLISSAALSNIYWIPGRTDIFVTFFGLLYIFLIIKNPLEHRYHYFILSGLSLTLGFMSKETILVFIYYSVFLIHFLYRKHELREQIFLFSPMFLFTLSYFFYRYIIFSGNPFGTSPDNFEFSLNYITKILIYDILSLFIPIDALDLFALYQSYFLVFMIIIAVILIIALVFFLNLLQLKNKNNRTLFVSMFFILVSSTFVYFYNSYPQLRLMYAHIPLLFILIFIIDSHLDSTRYFAIIIIYFLLQIVSISFVLNSFINITDYYAELENRIIENKQFEKQHNVMLTSLGRVGLRWVDPNINYSSYYWINKKIGGKYGNFSSAVFYETSSFNQLYELKYKRVDSTTIDIFTKNHFDGLTYMPARKFKSLKDTITLDEGCLKIIPLEFQKNRYGLATKCRIIFKKTQLNTFYLYYLNSDGQVVGETLSMFMKRIEV